MPRIRLQAVSGMLHMLLRLQQFWCLNPVCWARGMAASLIDLLMGLQLRAGQQCQVRRTPCMGQRLGDARQLEFPSCRQLGSFRPMAPCIGVDRS